MRKSESRHGYYFLWLIMMMLLFLLITIPIIWLTVFNDVGQGTGYGIIILSSILFGYFAIECIKRVMHKEKNEILAGIVIPLPAAIILTAFMEFFTRSDIPTSIHHPLVAGLLFCFFFNLRFIVEFFEHHKHKHYISLYLVIPIVMMSVIMATDALVDSRAININPESDSNILSANVNNYITSCIERLAEDNLSEKSFFLLQEDEKQEFADKVKANIENNLLSCADFKVFNGTDISTEKPNATIIMGLSDISITVKMKTIISSKNSKTVIDEYFIRVD